ncbi:hypothetical protein [Nonomuraea sp. NPDC049784]|uniref:hypothetical protein n=1 Tax=Nonomuraea sp. NPDC049784 TaxID=3154361 RepID=UPI00340EDBDD
MVHDGVVTFDLRRGAWVRVGDVALPTFVRWVLSDGLVFHTIGRRYRRIHLPGSSATIQRSAGWTTQRSTDAKTAHETVRQRQEAAKRARHERARLAEKHRDQVERERQRQEEERRHAEVEERRRRLMIEWERQRVAWEAEHREQQRQQQEQARREELARLERDRQEQSAVRQWWSGLSTAQLTELLDHVAVLSVSEHASRALPVSDQGDREHGYGIAVYTGHRLYGVVRPCPHSLGRLSHEERASPVRSSTNAWRHA